MKLHSFLVALALLVSANSYAEQTSQCSQIADKAERLECFDREFPNGIKASAKTPPSVKATQAAELSAAEAIKEGVVADQSAQKPKKDKKEMLLGGLFDWQSQPEVETEIAAIRSESKQRMVFRLANGQIWMQSTPRALPFKAGDKVTIKSGRMGGYIMRSAGGTSSRVKLIEG